MWTTLDLLAGQPGGPGWVDGSLTAAHFASPWAITQDDAGRLLVADQHALRVVDVSLGQVTTLAGVYDLNGSADGIGAQATFNNPSGVAFASGALFVTDTENHTLRRVDVSTAAVTTVGGAAGQPGTLDATGADARFREPEGLAFDRASSTFFVGDTDNNTIRSVVFPSLAVSTIAGSAGTAGAMDGVGANASFSKPKAVALDGNGNPLVADAVNQSVRRVDVATGMVTTVAQFAGVPQGLAVDGTDVIVALGDDSIARVASDGTITTLAGSASARGFVDGAGADARFNSPAGLWNDGAGTLYVADNGNAVLRAISLSDATVRTVAGALSLGSSDGSADRARFSAVQGMASGEASVYVADTGNDTIRQIALSSGDVTTLAGSPGQPGFADGSLADARFNQPQGIAFDAATQTLYVADSKNRRIRRIDLRAGMVSTLLYAIVPGGGFTGFDMPSGIALDQGRLFVADYTDDVVVAIDLQAGQATVLAGTSGTPGNADGVGAHAAFYGPLGVTADGHGHLFVADDLNETVRQIDVASATVSTIGGEPVTPGSNDGTGGAAHFHYPSDVVTDGLGDVFVSDTFNNAIRQIQLSSDAVTTIVGAPTPTGVRLGPLPAQLSQPLALALTPSGDLLIASENSILRVH